ncbi:MAG: translation initiation factor IF-2 N-terminal domain-containing protein [[Ruminococcus] torques]
MTKMRVHELAKELGMENKELIDLLHKKNVEVSNHMSSIEDNIQMRSEKKKTQDRRKVGEKLRKRKI